MDVHELAVQVRNASYGTASPEAVTRQVAVIERRLTEHAGDFGYGTDDLSGEQAAVLHEVYTSERDLPVVEADDIRDLYEAHEPDAVPHNDDAAVLAVDEAAWDGYALMSTGDADQRGLRTVYTAAHLAKRLGGAELTEDLAHGIAWEVTSEVSPG